MAASATFALKAGVWFRRGRLLMVSPDSAGTACPLSGRNSTYRPVQISPTSSHRTLRRTAQPVHAALAVAPVLNFPWRASEKKSPAAVQARGKVHTPLVEGGGGG